MSATNRLWVLVTAMGCVAIAALGWLLGISPKLAEASAADEQRVLVDGTNQGYAAQLTKLKSDYEHLGEVKQQLEDAQAQLPPNSNYPAFLSELDSIAADNTVSVTNVTFGAAAVVGATVADVAAAAASSAASAASAAPTNSPVPTARATVPATGSVGSIVAIPAVLTMTGSLSNLQSAAGALQIGKRLFLASGLSFTQTEGGGGDVDNATTDSYSLVITGLLYVLTDGTTLVTVPAPTATPVATPAP